MWPRELAHTIFAGLTISRTYSITDDSASEPDETITFALPTVTPTATDDTYTTTSTDITITIRANDAPVFSVASAAAETTEGETVEFTVTLGGDAPTGAATVDWAVTGTGITTGDYTVSGAGAGNRGTLTFAALGSQMLNFAITADSVTEPAETLTVTLSNPSSGSVIGTASASTTIAASDQPHDRTLTVTGATTHAEGDSNAEIIYTVTMSGNRGFTASSTTVTWTVTHGTTADADFVAAADRSGTVEFTGVNNAPDGFRTFTVNIAGDDLNEAAESFSVQVSVADPDTDGGTAYGPPARTTITDDDPITATLATSTVNANEGADAIFIVNLTGGEATAPVVIRYANADASGSLTIPTGTTSGMLTLTATDDMLSEDMETIPLAASDFTATSAGTVNIAGSASLTINADSSDDITVTVAPPAAANTGRTAEFTVAMSNRSAAAVTVEYTVALTVDGAAVTLPAGSVTPASQLSIAAGSTSGTISVAIPADVSIAESGSLSVTLTSATAATGGGMAGLGAATTATVEVISDDPAAREVRLEAPLASAGRGVGQVAVAAVQQRLRVGGAGAGGGSSLTIAGRDFAGAEVLAAEFLASGYATGARDLSADELLRTSAFNLAGRDGGRGFNFWGSGGFVSAEGEHDGVDYDGDTSAFTLGIDTNWKGGLVGVAVTRSDGDTDFTVKADNTEHTLETEVTGFHPYLTRRLNRSQLWLTAGFGTGDAEVKEPDDVVIKTDITVTTAAFGITQTRGDLFTGNLSALYTRAKLDAAAGRNALNATTADSLRLTANADIGWTLGALRPFLTFALRHDSGDGDTGGAADLGGGVEWRTPTVYVRLAGSGHIQGQAADEQRATLTVRKSTGDFDLSLNLAADGSDIDTARLLTGEWRF